MDKKSPIIIAIASFALLVMLSSPFVFSPVWKNTAAGDYNAGIGVDFNWTKVTGDGNVMPTGSDRVYVEQDQAFYDANLIGYWRFDDANATHIFDDTNNNNDGSFENGADINAWGLWDTNALFLDGVDDYVVASDSASLDRITATSGMTVSAWINPVSFGGGNNARIVAKSDTSSTNGWNFLIREANPNAVGIQRHGGGDSVYADSVIILNTWQYVAATIGTDGTSVNIYYNGEVKKTASLAVAIGTNNLELTIGNRSGDFGRQFDGFIEELKIYNRELTADEIQQDYNNWMTSHYYSPIKDAGDSETIWNTIEWQEATDVNNSLTVDYRGCSTADCGTAGDWLTGLSTGGTAYTLHADLNRYFQYRVNFDTNTASWNPVRVTAVAGGTDKGSFAKFSNVEIFYNRLPDVNVWMVEGYDVSGAMPPFTVGDGNLTIDFNFADDNNFLQAHNVDINYSTTTTQGSGTSIVTDLNVDGNFCVTNLIGGWEVDQTDVNLVGYWSFDEDDGVTIYDKSGNGNSGTYTDGADNNANGKWDTNALFLDGNTDHVTLPQAVGLAFEGASEVSINVWVKRNATSGSAVYRMFNVPLTGSDVGSDKFHIEFDNDRVEFSCKTERGDGTTVRTTDTFTDKTVWYHLVSTCDTSIDIDNLKVYVNGILNTTASYDFTLETIDNDVIDEITISGRFNSGSGADPDRFFDGYIEEVKIYDKVLTAQEISQDYNYGIINKRKCSWDWDITGVADDNYYINIMSKELGFEADFDSADNSFHVVVSAEGVCDCPASGNWEINDGSICTLSSLCNLPADLHITSGSLNVSATGELVLASGNIIIIEKGEFLYTEKGGKIVIEK